MEPLVPVLILAGPDDEPI